MAEEISFVLNQFILFLEEVEVYANKLLSEFVCDSASWTQLTTRNFRQFDNVRLVYRKLQVLHVLAQNVVSSLIRPIITVTTNQIIFCNYSIIRYVSNISVPILIILSSWSVVGTAAVLFGLSSTGETHSLGKKILRSMKNKKWGSKRNNKEIRKFVRSCKPISFNCGRSFVLRKISVLKALKAIVRGTFRALLTA
ncbi:unnamed protein product [Orchesella dallaii]|uniref:Uncharacterized protein n=1 Tax=Orchesella dallaii TaxID=48710 RepID=A0ABP1S879_9HEXA